VSATGSLLERFVPSGASDGRARELRAWLEVHGLPTSRQEAWKYTALDDIFAALDLARPPVAVDDIDRTVVDELAADLGGPRLVFVNGALSEAASDLHTLPPGLWAGARHGRGEDEPADGFVALNELAATGVATLVVDDGAQIDEPVHIVHLAVPGDTVAAVHPRSFVDVGQGSRVDVVETFCGAGGKVISNAATRIITRDGAHLRYHRIQDETDEALHVGRTRIDQAAGSDVCATSVMTGASIARSAIDVHLDGPEAHLDLRGLYLPTGRQHHDNVITVDHTASHCRSSQLFKGVMDGFGRGSFTGHVIVRPGAAATDASQSNRNLLLRSTAQADTRPWLEILADDVRCSHGATVGRLDDDALFYLRSRGIPLAESRALLVAAFVGDIVDGLTPASLRDRVAAAFARRVAGVAG
jgi:Fe-S cluster assembly protein SufD